MRARFELVELESGRAIVLRRGKVLLANPGERGTIFNARQARRWMKHHPQRPCAPVALNAALESGVAA